MGKRAIRLTSAPAFPRLGPGADRASAGERQSAMVSNLGVWARANRANFQPLHPLHCIASADRTRNWTLFARLLAERDRHRLNQYRELRQDGTFGPYRRVGIVSIGAAKRIGNGSQERDVDRAANVGPTDEFQIAWESRKTTNLICLIQIVANKRLSRAFVHSFRATWFLDASL
jgi:hypothetical protein